jgi:hypothetical protein
MPPGLRRIPPRKSQKNLRKSMPQKLAQTASNVVVRQMAGAVNAGDGHMLAVMETKRHRSCQGSCPIRTRRGPAPSRTGRKGMRADEAPKGVLCAFCWALLILCKWKSGAKCQCVARVPMPHPCPMSKKKPTNPQLLRDLIPVGPKHVQIKHRSKRDENGLKPSTSRALVLRNGKYGARGTGEVILAGRISGREKLDLLAGTSISSLSTQLLTAALEDLTSQKSRTALMAPFKLNKCIKIADSQYNGMLKHTGPVLYPLLSSSLPRRHCRSQGP